ncbi:MAG: TerB family tellurite resistance protein [Candidatus Hydrogenedentes bacterium]|nr:TerB family tellurite resistance protein [Candidatus Hydrogenedentota bacterium]
MLNRIKQVLLGSGKSTAPEQAPHERLELATCVLLLEAARIDDEFTNDERRHILHAVRQRFELREEEAEELLEAAMEVRDESTDLFRFTAELNGRLTQQEKLAVLEEIWRIFYSDGTLDGHEDHLAHKLRNLLNLNHPQMIESKMKVLNELRGQPE